MVRQVPRSVLIGAAIVVLAIVAGWAAGHFLQSSPSKRIWAIPGASPDHLETAVPESAGMSAPRLQEVTRIIQRGIDAGGFPGAAVVIGRKSEQVLAQGLGHLDWTRKSPVVSPDSTVYDLASLTKVVATTSAIMALYDDGVIGLDDQVSKWIPKFTGGLKDSVTIRHLLTHRSGLPPGRPIWKLKAPPGVARDSVIATPLAKGCPPGACYMYSDLGADLLGFVVEAASHRSLDVFTQQRIFQPLEMSETTFHPRPEQLRRLAPTGAPRGRVHDANAAALGGAAGHAGLFSTASDLAVFAQMLLNGGAYEGVHIFKPSTVHLFTTRAAGTRALGWDTCDSADVRSTCGQYLSARAFGHTGFTGTSMWIDPDRQMFMILLTNRVDAGRAKRPALVIHDIRADIADAAVLSVLDAQHGAPGVIVAFRSDKEQHWQEPVSTRKAKARRQRRRRGARRSRRTSRSKKRHPVGFNRRAGG